ncbi:unnamed protein product [Prunus armeniaca]
MRKGHCSSCSLPATSCSLKHKLDGVFFEHYVPGILSQATSLTSIAGKLLLEAQTQWSPFQALCPRHTETGDEPYLYCKQAAPRSTNSMESFSSIMSLTYARRQQASSLLQTNCSSKHKLNGVFFEHYIPDICSQVTSLTSTEDKLLLEYKLHGVFSSVMSLTYAHKRRALPSL